MGVFVWCLGEGPISLLVMEFEHSAEVTGGSTESRRGSIREVSTLIVYFLFNLTKSSV